jgi:hypothetical protein
MEQNFFIYPAAYDTYINAKTQCQLNFPQDIGYADLQPHREFLEWYEIKPGSWY